MSGWMERAQAVLGRKAQKVEEASVSFEISCACGEVAIGTRGPVSQRVRCNQCHRWLFVLPTDPYPVPVAKPQKIKQKRKQQRKRGKKRSPAQPTHQTEDHTAVVSPIADSSAEPKDEPVADPSPSGKSPSQQLADDAQQTVTAAVRTASRWRRKILTPFRLVMLGIVIVVVGTMFSVWNRSRLDQAERTWQIAREKGRAALTAGDFSTAVREFQKAVHSVNILERDDQSARMTRQRLREATAVNQLLPVSIPEMIGIAEKTIQANPLGWKDQFEETYRGRWLVMETSLVRVAEADGRSRVVIDCPLVIGTRNLELTGALAAFRTLNISDVPQRVVFAASMRSCELSETLPAYWVITLDRESAFLWTDFDIYRQLGLAGSDADGEQQTRKLLTAQLKNLGVGEKK